MSKIYDFYRQHTMIFLFQEKLTIDLCFFFYILLFFHFPVLCSKAIRLDSQNDSVRAFTVVYEIFNVRVILGWYDLTCNCVEIMHATTAI